MAEKLLKLSTHLFVPLFSFSLQPRMTGYGRTAFPTNVARCCSKPSTTCWSAASWIAASFASASGLSNRMRRMRSPSTRGMLAPLALRTSCPRRVLFMAVLCACTCTLEMGIVLAFFLHSVALSDMLCLLLFGCDMVWCSSGWALLQQAQGSQFLCLVECVGYWTHTSRVRGSAPTAAPDTNIQYVFLWLLIKRLLLNSLYCTRDLLLMFYLLLISI